MANPSFYTLESIAQPGATTPIATQTASEKSFCNDYYKINAPNISMRERMALAIICLLRSVTPNYKTNHAGLIQDAKVYTGGISSVFDEFSALVGPLWTVAKVADATLSSDVPTLLGEARDLSNLSEDQLMRIYIFLRCQLLT